MDYNTVLWFFYKWKVLGCFHIKWILHQNLLWSSSALDYAALSREISTSQFPHCRKTAQVTVYFRTEHCCKCVTCINSCNCHNNPEKVVILSSYFIDEGIEAWRVTLELPELVMGQLTFLTSILNAIGPLLKVMAKSNDTQRLP